MATYYVTTSGSDASAGTSEGAAFATPGKAAATATLDDDIVNVREGNYPLTTGTPGAGGPVVLASSKRQRWRVYQSTAGDNLGVATIDAAAQTGVTLFTASAGFNNSQHVRGFSANGRSGAGNNGFLDNGSYAAFFDRMLSIDCPGYGFKVRGIEASKAMGCGVGFDDISPSTAFGCHADTCTTGFYSSTGNRTFLSYCLATNCTGVGFLLSNAFNGCLTNSTAYGNGGGGVSISTYEAIRLVNVLSWGNTGSDIANKDDNKLSCCAAGSGKFTTPLESYGMVTLTADPFVDAAGGDFRPNDVSGGGALVRGAGLVIPGQLWTPDIGALQHAESGGNVIVIED